MNHWVMDYETLSNFFCGVFEHYKTSERKIFIVHELQNDFQDLLNFFEENEQNKEWHISFNGLAFDAQITHYIIDNREKLSKLSPAEIAADIYRYAGHCISLSRSKQFQDYPLWKMGIGQIDLFKMHHWDNPAKRSSLKWIQYSMDWDNIIDMPIPHETNIKTQEEVDLIIKYCINDVASTKEIFNRSKSQIKLRKELSSTYDINLFSASEPRIAKELFAYYLSKKLRIDKREIKKMRTTRSVIKVKDLVLPYIKFTSPTFINLLNRFESLELNPENLKGSFKYSMNYKNVKTDFGLGGVHGARRSGVYKSDDDHVIMTSDVTSFYPNLCIRNKWSPGHFPKDEFCDQYEWFFEERKKIPKSNPMNYVYKIILNSTFGLSNDVNSFFYDPELCMRITVNGQLSLMMLYEMIMERIPGAIALLQNTDGLETRIPKEYVDEYLEICTEWEEITNLNLEHEKYQKLVLGDVNNYIAINEYSKVDLTTWRKIKEDNPHYLYKIHNQDFMFAPVKLKGRFDFHDLALHKNKSKLVIPKAIFHYFVKDVLPEDYLKENRNILDYCIGSKSKGDWQTVAKYIDKNREYKEDKLQKINRYYISKSGVKLTKINSKDNRQIQLEAGHWMQTMYNDMKLFPKWEQYSIDMSYYMKAIESEIDNILNVPVNQTKLF
jgi:hypothetical protein